MSSFFNLDSGFMRALSKMADLMWINVLTMICCIPIITIGASFTAMHTMVYRVYKNEEGYLTREFFKAFKSNFRQSTLMWLIYLVIGLVLGLDLWLIYGEEAVDMGMPFKVVICLAALVYLFSLIWVFVLQSRYENPIRYTMKNTLIVSMTHAPYSMMMVILFISPIVLLIFFDWATPICFLLGLAVPAFVQSILYARVFDKIEGKKDEKDDGEEAEKPDDWTLETEAEDAVDRMPETLKEAAARNAAAEEAAEAAGENGPQKLPEQDAPASAGK